MQRRAPAPVPLYEDPLAGTHDAVLRPHWEGHRDRLRARLLAGGDALPDYEILEALLFAAIPRIDVKPLAKALLAEFGGLGPLLAATPKALEKSALETRPAARALLKAVHAASLHVGTRELSDDVLASWGAVERYLQRRLGAERSEQVRVLYLDHRNRLLADEAQGNGTAVAAPLYPVAVARRAVQLDAKAVILAHNHPSGDPNPSRADVETTRAVQRALTALEIQLHDHVIVGAGKPVSMRSLGLLD
ncbi:JAB domain-containing protein [Roseiterribacter gracilis]|uniref:DNA repair protein RadC n=1 Tax=Roseiterribacter gracilis TaxID=2812848 RepID=A0A8S8XD55_9PROT|nr:DNA repair protein RadC [Rhodospirillales bacterium TMPK1]